MSESEQTPGGFETEADSDDIVISERSALAQIVNRYGVDQRIKDLFAKAIRAEDGDDNANADLARFLTDEGYSIIDYDLAVSFTGTVKTVPKTIMSICARVALKSTLEN